MKRNDSDPKTEPQPHQANPPAAECPAERHGTGSSEEPNTRMAKKSDPRKKPRKVASKKTDFVPKGYEKLLGELNERTRKPWVR